MSTGRRRQPKIRRHIERMLADAFDMPHDAIADLPRIVLVGDGQLRIENHRGLMSCHSAAVVVSAGSGIISIHGIDLIVDYARRDRIVVSGKIKSVSLEG